MPKYGIFGTQLKHFCFFAKLCEQKNLRVLISNITIFFKKILAQKYTNKTFFSPEFSCQTNSRVLISNMTTFIFKCQPKNTKILHFQSKIQTFSFLHKILQLDKYDGVGFKYDSIIFKFQPKKSKSGIFGPKCKDF